MFRGNILQSRMHRGGFAILWGCLAAFSCAAMIPLEPSLLEEGMILHFAQRMAHGEHLYRDLVFFSGPLPFELLAALFRLLGEEVAVARWSIVVLGGAACASSFELARRSGAGPLAHAVGASFACAPVFLFPLLSTYYYTTLALSLSVLAAFAALLGTRRPRWAIVTGCLVSFVALTKQNVGILLAPGLLLALATTARPEVRVRQASYVAAGGALVMVTTLCYYAASGSLGPLVHSMVVMPLSLGQSFGSPYVNFWPIGEFARDLLGPFYVPQVFNVLRTRPGPLPFELVLVTQILYALPFVALASVAVRRLLGGPLHPGVWIYTALALAFIANVFPRSDWGHLAFALPPSLGLLLISLGPPSRSRRSLRRGAVAGLLAMAMGAGALRLGIALRGAAGDATLGPRVPQRAVSPIYKRRDLRRAVEFIRTRVEPGEAIFVARAEPLLYFATDTRNPTPYGGIIPGLGEEQDRTVVEALSQVRYVAMSERDSTQYYYYRDELPATQRYLERRFRVPDTYAEDWSWMLILERGEDRGATAVDLFDIADQGSRWVVDQAGRERPIPREPPRLATRLNRRPLPVLLGRGGGGVDFDIEIPEGGVFQAGLGIRVLQGDSQQFEHVRACRFEISIRKKTDFEVAGSIAFRMNENTAGNWTPVEIDLRRFAGERATLRMQVIPDKPLRSGGIAWWGSPRLISRSASAAELR